MATRRPGKPKPTPHDQKKRPRKEIRGRFERKTILKARLLAERLPLRHLLA
jgi:hypothetical protein